MIKHTEEGINKPDFKLSYSDRTKNRYTGTKIDTYLAYH